MPKTTVSQIGLYYEVVGEGPPVILISGLGYSAWMWHRMTPYLAAEFQVITFDNRGSGRSDKPAGPYHAWMLADDTAGLLNALSIHQAHVVGHSMGGFVAQALALAHPERIQRLVLSATNFGGPNHIPIEPEAMSVLTDVSGDPVDRLRRGIAVSTAPGFLEEHPEIVEGWLAHRISEPIDPTGYQAQLAVGLGLLPAEKCFEPRLKEVRAQTLILFGEYDHVVPVGNAYLLKRVIPNSRVNTLAGAGHFYPLEKPEEAARVIADFLTGRLEPAL